MAKKRGKAKRKPGRPKAEINIETLRGLALIHCTIEEAAQVLGVHPDTLENRIKDEPELQQAWEGGKATGKMSLRRLQWRHANGTGNSAVHMAIHLSKHWLKQTEKVLNEHTGKDGGPIDSRVSYVVETPPVEPNAEEWAKRYAPPKPAA